MLKHGAKLQYGEKMAEVLSDRGNTMNQSTEVTN